MTSPLKNIPRRTLSIQLTEFCPSRIMASEIFSSVHKLPIMPKCRDQILQSNFSRVQVNGPGPPALGRKGRRFTINNGRKQMRTGKSAFYRHFWRCSSACLSIFWSLETSSAPPQSLLPNTGSIFLPFRWRQENPKFELNFGYNFFLNHNTCESPLCPRQRDQIKAQMECVGYLQIVAEQI